MVEACVSFISLLCPYHTLVLSNSPGRQLASFKVCVAVGQELLLFREDSICHVITAFSVVYSCTQKIPFSQVPRNPLSLGLHLREPFAFSLPLSFRRSQSTRVLAILWFPRSPSCCWELSWRGQNVVKVPEGEPCRSCMAVFSGSRLCHGFGQ